jgi:hypothetical protein
MASHISSKNTEKKGQGTKGGATHGRTITARFFVPVNIVPVEVCKTMYMLACGITSGKTDALVHKKEPSAGITEPDKRGSMNLKTTCGRNRGDFSPHKQLSSA